MCISPILIENPNHGHFVRGSRLITDVTSKYIRVPCGHCFECCAKKTLQFSQRCYFMSKDYYFFFGMLSYAPNRFHHFELNGHTYAYASYKDVKNMIKRIREKDIFGRDMRYVFVREYGGKKHRLHWHFLVLLKKLPTDSENYGEFLERKVYDTFLNNWLRNVGTKRHPLYMKLLEYHEVWRNGIKYSNYDCHLVRSRGLTEDKVYYYLVKYLFKHDKYVEHLQVQLKDDCKVLGLEDDYKKYWNLIRPMYVTSKGFGIDSEHSVESCFDGKSDSLPMIQVGASLQPISNYYQRKFLSYEQKVAMMEKYKDENGDIRFCDSRSVDDVKKQESEQAYYDSLFGQNDYFDLEDIITDDE